MADQKITELPLDSTPASTDLIVTVKDPTGTPVNRGVEFANVGKAHTIASHSDTTATGLELETLTDSSDASSLHSHTTDNLNDTNATGANLNTLTEGGNATGLHSHPGAGSGDVVGPGTGSTDNAIARFDGTTGQLLQNSAVSIDDDGNISPTGSIDLNVAVAPAYKEGRLFYDSDVKSISYYPDES
ncbi:unnamed protein product, partial [marine sediment metagenome]